MKYNKIRKMDIANGPGIRVSIFMQGCSFHCEGCFSEETWDFKKGKDFTEETINQVIELCKNHTIKGLSILGGEALHPKNIEGTTQLAKAFKKNFPKKDLWVWTGFLFENIKDKEVLNYIDVLVDGQFQIKNRNPKLKYCGSTNQRVIDVKKSLKKGEVVLFYKEVFQ